MIQIYIGTYNRSAKLERVLHAYSLWDNPPEVVVYDGSDETFHKNKNSRLSAKYSFLKYLHIESSVLERLRLFIDSSEANSIFFLGNDEDIFLEKFCFNSYNIMLHDQSLSTVIGSYLTFWTPFLQVLPRLSLRKLVPTSFRITGNFLDKICTHSCFQNSLKLPSLFYGPQYKDTFRDYLNKVEEHELKYSTCELLHQFHLLLNGDILFLEEIMLLRDETRIDYFVESRRQGDDTYIENSELDLVFNLVLGGSSEVSHYWKNIYSPSISIDSKMPARHDFMMSYLSPITPLVFSTNPIVRIFYRSTQALTLRLASVLNACIFVLASLAFGKSMRFFSLKTAFNPLSVNA